MRIVNVAINIILRIIVRVHHFFKGGCISSAKLMGVFRMRTLCYGGEGRRERVVMVVGISCVCVCVWWVVLAGILRWRCVTLVVARPVLDFRFQIQSHVAITTRVAPPDLIGACRPYCPHQKTQLISWSYFYLC